MGFFDAFVSCTAAGSGSQNWFETADPAERITGRIYFRLSRDVRRGALLYSNLIDSTFADGSHSHANFVPGPWTIHALRVGPVASCGMDDAPQPAHFAEVTFGGAAEKRVAPGEIFATDPFDLTARKGEYLCVEMTFSGARVPCHTESLLPAFRRGPDGWFHDVDMPFPSMVGAARGTETRLGFIGDSITQGIGTEPNSYTHMAALVQEVLGGSCAVWDLGLGFGRAHDAALDGGWLYKARQNDVVCVCFGVNDLFQTRDPGQLKKDLTCIVRALKKSGVRVVIQTVPPFDYAPEIAREWLDVNDHIRRNVAREADAVFDTVPVLCLSPDEPHRARYGAHPNAEGNARWAEAIAPVLRGLM